MKRMLKAFLGEAPGLQRAMSGKRIVLAYHRVLPSTLLVDADPHITVSDQAFRKQMEWLRQSADVVAQHEMPTAVQSGPPPAVFGLVATPTGAVAPRRGSIVSSEYRRIRLIVARFDGLSPAGPRYSQTTAPSAVTSKA